MRTFKILLLLVAVILSGFSRDSQTDENVILNNGTKDEVVVPLKIWCVTIPLGPLNLCGQASYGKVQGHQTHGGNLIPGLSEWTITGCAFKPPILQSILFGTNTVANGDSYDWTGYMEIDVSSKNVIFDVEINCGTGRFEGVQGYAHLTGPIDLVSRVINFKGEGKLTFPK
jgi:hypothetical protein